MSAHNDCCDTPKGHTQLPVEQALALLLSHARPVADFEGVTTMEGLGRVLAEPVYSTIDVPGWDNSAMDGYAVRAADLTRGDGLLRVTQRIPAGVSGPMPLPKMLRIWPGAMAPAAKDAP